MPSRKPFLKKSASGPRRPATGTLLVGDPFFVTESARARYHRALAQWLRPELLSHGSRALRWRSSSEANDSWLYSDETELGVLPLFNFSATAFYARQGLLQPLDDLFPSFHNTFLDMGWRKGFVSGRLFSVPLHLSIRLLFFRRDLLRKYGFEPPRTWPELESQAAAIQKAERSPSLRGLLFNFNQLVRFSVFLDHVWSQGGDLYESTPRWTLDRRGLETALSRVQRLFREGLTPPEALASDYGWSYREFLGGRSVFLHNWSDGIRMIRELPLAEQERFGWCALPSLDARLPGRSMIGGASLAIPRATRYPRAAAKLLQRILHPDFQSWYAEHLGWPFPGLKQAYFDARVMKAKPYFAEAEGLLRHGRLLEERVYLHHHHLDWQAIGGQELTRLLEGQSTPQETVQRMEQRFAPLLPQPAYSGLTGQALAHIQANLERPLTVAQLARHLRVSPEHLSRVFRRETRRGLHESIHAAKMERAKALLKQGQMAVGEVAYRLGYKTPQHFSRVFKQLVRRRPKEYRA